MSQSVCRSWQESWSNIFIGFGINFIANITILPLFGFKSLTWEKNIFLGIIYTCISLLRSFCIRRWFNRKEVQSNYGAYATKLNLTKDTVKRSLLELSDRKIIVLAVITKEQFVITINKDYELWKIE